MPHRLLRPRILLAFSLAVAILGLALRLFIAARDIDVVDRLFIPDDTYYTLSIARSMANGLGPTADGTTLTNGFQPLLAFLQIPMFWMTSDPDRCLRMNLVVLCFVDFALAILLGRIAGRLAGGVAALLATALWSFSPHAITMCLGGLETTLSLFCTAAIVLAWIQHREAQVLKTGVWLGVWIGLAQLARVDTAFLILMVGGVELIKGDRKALFAIVATSLAVVSPWWCYSFLTCGTVIPESGAAARELAFLYQGAGLLARSPGWAAGRVLGGPFLSVQMAERFLFRGTPLGHLFAFQIWLCFVWIAIRAVRPLRHPVRIPMAALTIHVAVLTVFYTFWVPVVWFFHRYLSVSWIAGCVMISALAARGLRRAKPGPQRVLVWCGIAVLWLLPLTQSCTYLWNPGVLHDRWAVEGATGYREPTLGALQAAPPGAVVGGLQSGALSYYAPAHLQIVNLDGVVDKGAARAVAGFTMARHAQDQGVTHFCDWPLQHHLFNIRSANPPVFKTVWTADQLQHSRHVLQLSEIHYPSDDQPEPAPLP